MGSLLLFEFQPENQPQVETAGFFVRLAERIRGIFLEVKAENLIEAVVLSDDITANKVKMPCSLSRFLEGNAECSRIFRGIPEDGRWGIPFVPQQIPDEKLPAGISKNDGKQLFKAMMVSVLRNIFDERGIKICDLDITIIHGTDRRALNNCINMLSPLVRYLTVTGQDMNAIESDIDEIYTETGLSVGLSSDPRRAVKNADVVINLGNLDDVFRSGRINTGAVILNYGTSDLCTQMWGGVLINCIETRLPASLAARLGKRIIEDYGATQLAELLLFQRLMQVGRNGEENIHTLGLLESEYYAIGCTMSGLTGRHSIIDKREIKLRHMSHPAG